MTKRDGEEGRDDANQRKGLVRDDPVCPGVGGARAIIGVKREERAEHVLRLGLHRAEVEEAVGSYPVEHGEEAGPRRGVEERRGEGEKKREHRCQKRGAHHTQSAMRALV